MTSGIEPATCQFVCSALTTTSPSAQGIVMTVIIIKIFLIPADGGNTYKDTNPLYYLSQLFSDTLPDTKFRSTSSSLTRQPLVGPGLLKKLCPLVSVEGDFLPILDP